MYTIVPNRFWHKLSYFLFLSNFWNITYYLCWNFYKIKNMQILIANFEFHIFKFKNLKLRQSRHTSMSHKLKKNVFFHFLWSLPTKNFRIKKSSAMVKNFKIQLIIRQLVAESNKGIWYVIYTTHIEKVMFLVLNFHMFTYKI
jgi:hypothetical protein